LIVRKISKLDATRRHILRVKCIKFDLTGGAYSVPPDSLAVFKGPTSNRRAGEDGGEEKGREGKGRGGGSEGRRK